MRLVRLLGLAVVLAAPGAQAASSRAEPPMEARLSAWLGRQDFARRAAAAKPVAAPAAAAWFDAGDGLKDAVADEPQDRRSALARLPGMEAQPFEGCRALRTCEQAPLSFQAESSGLDDAIRGLLRPWILLQAAKGRGLSYRAAPSEDRLMTVGLEGTDVSLAVDAQPLADGGYEVRLEDGKALAARYQRERAALLGPVEQADQLDVRGLRK